MTRMLSDAEQRKALAALLEEPNSESDDDVGSSRGPNVPTTNYNKRSKQINKSLEPLGGSPVGRGYNTQSPLLDQYIDTVFGNRKRG